MTKYNYNLSEAPNYMSTSKYEKRKLSAEEIAVIKWSLAYYVPPDNIIGNVHASLLKQFSHKDFFMFVFTGKNVKAPAKVTKTTRTSKKQKPLAPPTLPYPPGYEIGTAHSESIPSTPIVENIPATEDTKFNEKPAYGMINGGTKSELGKNIKKGN